MQGWRGRKGSNESFEGNNFLQVFLYKDTVESPVQSK